MRGRGLITPSYSIIAFERWMIPRIDGLQYGQKVAGIGPIKKTNNMADMAYGLVV